MTVLGLALVIFLHGVFGPGLPAGTRSGRSASAKVLIGGLVPAVIPMVVITGIMLGVMTPTESGAVASIIALALGFIYREIKLRDLGRILLDVATNTATITGLIAAASVLSWVLAFQGVPDAVVEVMKGLTDSPFVFLLLVIVMLIALGMFLESISVLIVVVPLLMPVVATLGIDPIHFGVVCTVATVIGLVTPPVGPGLYIAMVQAEIRMGPLFRATIPFLAMVMAALVLIAAVPALSTWLPSVTAGK
jgi:tripartite ATP-independent transporter DctM subunit